jgi:hypothetical protein
MKERQETIGVTGLLCRGSGVAAHGAAAQSGRRGRWVIGGRGGGGCGDAEIGGGGAHVAGTGEEGSRGIGRQGGSNLRVKMGMCGGGARGRAEGARSSYRMIDIPSFSRKFILFRSRGRCATTNQPSQREKWICVAW